MNSIALAGIIKRVYPKFDMSTFENRLKLQKIIYLIQAYGIHLGYTFSLYHYGPFCLELMKTAYYVDSFENSKEVGFDDGKIEDKFKLFLSKMAPYKNDVKWLECASTMHLFGHLYLYESKAEIIKRVKTMKPRYSENDLNKIWGEMKEWL